MMYYERWMDFVDNHVQRTVGCSVYDLPDCPFRIWHDDGMSPLEAASEALKEAGYEAPEWME